MHNSQHTELFWWKVCRLLSLSLALLVCNFTAILAGLFIWFIFPVDPRFLAFWYYFICNQQQLFLFLPTLRNWSKERKHGTGHSISLLSCTLKTLMYINICNSTGSSEPYQPHESYDWPWLLLEFGLCSWNTKESLIFRIPGTKGFLLLFLSFLLGETARIKLLWKCGCLEAEPGR